MSSAFPSLGKTTGAFPLPSISEDTLFYSIHLPAKSGADTNVDVDIDAATQALLITEHVHSLLPPGWLWNKDGWELKVEMEGAGQTGGKLAGTMRVGDAVDDEWLVVWLLREVSKKWPELVISVRDTDGEFLLIEAAEELPSWVSPENASNRLWMQGGHLHLISLDIKSSGGRITRGEDEASINEQDALRAVRTGKYTVRGIEKAVWMRIAHYPSKMSEHLHRAKAYLPISIARALAVNPSLIQKAVEGFYVRDPAQLRGAARMTHFPPAPAVLAPVTMTRAAYAQLQGQVFHAPRVFGPEWHVREGEAESGAKTYERRWRDLGVKVATGFEIMYREGGKGRSGEADRPGEKEWAELKGRLERAGFFGDLREGSEGWKEKEQRALEGWRAVRASDTAQSRPSFAFLCDKAVQEAPAEYMPQDLTEDSDKWLEVSPGDLDAMLERAAGAAASASGGGAGGVSEDRDVPDEDGLALHDLAKKVEEFVGGEGDLAGARFADELSDDDDDDDDDDEEDDDDMQGGQAARGVAGEDDDDDEVPADPWARMGAAEKEERMRNLVASLPEEEWGAKPPKSSSADEVVVVGDTAADSPSKSKPSTASPLKNTRAPLFKQEYDGVDSDSDSEDEDEAEADLAPAGSLGRQIGQMRWSDFPPVREEGARIREVPDEDEGDVDVDMETSLDRKRDARVRWNDEDDVDEAMRARVWGGDEASKKEERPVVVDSKGEEVDMDGEVDQDVAENMDDFIAFARQVLGVGEEQWAGIVRDREARGAFVPSSASTKASTSTKSTAAMPPTSAPPAPAAKQPPTADPAPPPGPEHAQSGAALDSFEKVMAAMEGELSRAKTGAGGAASGGAGGATSGGAGQSRAQAPLPPLPTEADLEALDADELQQMDRELRAALQSAGMDDEDEDEDEEDGGAEGGVPEARGLEGEQAREYAMMRDFLESYRAQGGGSGAVGNLFGRLGK